MGKKKIPEEGIYDARQLGAGRMFAVSYTHLSQSAATSLVSGGAKHNQIPLDRAPAGCYNYTNLPSRWYK